jgi:choline-glycine betaine transporter
MLRKVCYISIYTIISGPRRVVIMITKVFSVYKVNIQEHYNQQSKERRKNKQQKKFEDILVEMLDHSPKKPVGYYG